MTGDKTKELWNDPIYRAKMIAVRKGKNIKHGMSQSNDPLMKKFYGTWRNMRQRCTVSTDKAYRNYGGRGIKVEWKSFEAFKNDMWNPFLQHIERYGAEDTSIDRLDNDGNYSQLNCRWATKVQQEGNKRPRLVCKKGHNRRFFVPSAKCMVCYDCKAENRKKQITLKKEVEEKRIQELISQAEERGFLEGQKHAFGVDRERVKAESAAEARKEVIEEINKQLPEDSTLLESEYEEGEQNMLDKVQNILARLSHQGSDTNPNEQ